MMIADLFTYNKRKYLVFITVFILINIIMHPLTVGYVPRNQDGTLNFAQAFSTSFVTWAISFNIIGLIIGGGIAAFKKRTHVPLQIKTARSAISTIFCIQLVCATLHMTFLTRDLFWYFFR
jgi:ABC-type molybdate transport system permease subunit